MRGSCPESMKARRTAAAGTSRRGRDGLQHHPFQRALAQLAGQQPAQEGLLVRGGRAEQLAEQRGPAGGGPGAGGAGQLVQRGVDRARPAATADAAGAASSPARVRQPAPIRPCRGSPASHAVAGSTSSGSAACSSAGQRGHLRLARPRGPDRGGGGDDVDEQHERIVAAGSDSAPDCVAMRILCTRCAWPNVRIAYARCASGSPMRSVRGGGRRGPWPARPAPRRAARRSASRRPRGRARARPRGSSCAP